MAEKLTAQQRANLFAMSTRQNRQMLAKQHVSTANTSMEFTLPKARLLANIYATVTAKVKVKHATEKTLPISKLEPYGIIRRWQLDLNNGFAPFSISGVGLALLNMIQPNANVCLENSAYYDVADELTASAEGTENTIKFTVQLPTTLNQRDPVGLILLQNEQTITSLRVDVGSAVDMFAALPSGYTVDIVDVEVKPMVETFSIPANASAMPDMSVLKLCNDRVDAITAAGQQIVKLSTGTIYRKLVLYITDAEGRPATDDFVTSNIELVFNQADINYSIDPAMIRAVNAADLGVALPAGVYIFDFSNNGFPNYGGTRDYIDSSNLTEFWVRFNANAQGKVKVISECISRLA